jgi:long-chain fatty acid transport protein
MAGAVGATAEGVESVYYNPGGGAFARRPSFSLGYQYAGFDLRYGLGDGPLGASEAIDAPALNIGFSVPIPFGGALKDRIALALGFTIPQTSILIADIERPFDPTFIVVENRAQTVSVQAALAVRVLDELAVGIGTIALAELDGEIGVAPNEAGRLGAKVKDELVADYALVAGAMLRLLPRDVAREGGEPRRLYGLRFGVGYRGESRADFKLPINADLGESFGIPIPEILVEGTAQFDPAELTFDVAVRPIDALTISLGATIELWSSFPTPIAYAAVPEGTPPQPRPDFHDTMAFKLGLEGELELSPEFAILPRLGFAFEPSPAPTQSGRHNHLDGDRAIFALGVGLHWGPVRLDIAGQLHDIAERTSEKGADISEDNPGFPSITSTGHILFFGIELGAEL